MTFFRCVFTIGIIYLPENFAHRKIRGILLGSAGVRRCPNLRNQCKYRLANQQSGRYPPATELEFIRVWNFPFREIV